MRDENLYIEAYSIIVKDVIAFKKLHNILMNFDLNAYLCYTKTRAFF